jgi:hypothetical protein
VRLSQCHHLAALIYNLIITTIVFPELAYSFIKTWFGEFFTPIGVGAGRDPKYGEAGWSVEAGIMGRKLTAEWDDVEDVGRMDSITRLLFITNSDTYQVGERTMFFQ